jgi:hypothetical protein
VRTCDGRVNSRRREPGDRYPDGASDPASPPIQIVSGRQTGDYRHEALTALKLPLPATRCRGATARHCRPGAMSVGCTLSRPQPESENPGIVLLWARSLGVVALRHCAGCHSKCTM